MIRCGLLWLVALALTAGVGLIAVDAARRWFTLNVFHEGYGEPVRSPPEAFRTAETNLIYLFGLAVGVVTGVALVIAMLAWLRIVRRAAR